jgi:hypothetical protein
MSEAFKEFLTNTDTEININIYKYIYAIHNLY